MLSLSQGERHSEPQEADWRRGPDDRESDREDVEAQMSPASGILVEPERRGRAVANLEIRSALRPVGDGEFQADRR